MQEIDLIALISYVFVNTFTPGPNNITCTSLAVLYGMKTTLKFIAGIITGFIALMILCGSLSGFLLKTIPAIEPIIKWIGVAYILWLAYFVLRASYSFGDDKETKPLGFWTGAVLQFVNPKAVIFGLTIYSVFLAPVTSRPIYVVGSALAFAVFTFTATFSWALFGTTIRRFLHNRRVQIAVNLFLVLLLVYTAAKLAGLL